LAEALTVTGVLSHFVYEGLREATFGAIREYAPGAFRGSASLLHQVDKEFDKIKEAVLKNHPSNRTLQIFLSPEKTIRGAVLNPLFEHIFQNKTLDSKSLCENLLQCRAYNDDLTPAECESLIGEIVEAAKTVYLSNSRTAPYVLRAAVNEIKNAFLTLQTLTPTRHDKVSTLYDLNKESFSLFCRDYLKCLKSYVNDLIINGLDAVTKKERLRHVLRDAYVPLTIDHILAVGDTPNQSGKRWRRNALEVMQATQRVIIRGPAGCGKTTLLQWYIIHCDPFR
jgi:hypothetical protein